MATGEMAHVTYRHAALALSERYGEGMRDGVARTAPGAATQSLTVSAGTLGPTAQLLGALALVFPYANAPELVPP